ncbi:MULTISPECIES: hypothetical protein [unclassified Solwaraspora]|uniref:hypothetical protein n=1 Tax=unclassified Solwaraspora TaxID=2627926 RepID=UPI00259B9534|nr:hypothetical protein [Solwaraspora sp. WMMA2056]WJK42039.1 hypothetical protein O7608_06490 [Solwaraspora sp. WMMA2056]
MDAVTQVAADLTRCADQLAETARRLPDLDSAVDAVLGGDAPGRLGELTATLVGHWHAATAQRAAEAAEAARRLTDTAAALRAVAQAYRDIDTQAGQHHPEAP